MKAAAPRNWSLDETRILIDRRARGDHPKQIARALGRTQASVIGRLQYHNAGTIANAQRVQREGKYAERYSGDGGSIAIDPILCPSIIAAWDENLAAEARRDLTATICGDPPPGRSALDRRQLDGAGT